MPESLPGDWSKLCQVFASSLLDNDHVGKAKEWETKAAELQQEAVLKIISAAVRLSRLVCLTALQERLLAEDSNSPAPVTPIKRSFTRRVIRKGWTKPGQSTSGSSK